MQRLSPVACAILIAGILKYRFHHPAPGNVLGRLCRSLVVAPADAFSVMPMANHEKDRVVTVKDMGPFSVFLTVVGRATHCPPV